MLTDKKKGVPVSMTDKEKAELQVAAKAQGLSFSAFILQKSRPSLQKKT